MNLIELGLTAAAAEELKRADMTEFTAGRVTQEHRERYIVTDGTADYEAEITGNMRYTAASRSDFPAVGDWVLMKKWDEGQAIIHSILPRKSVLKRQAVGKTTEEQVIAANIDCALIVQALSNNFNINRLERYLSICYEGGIEPVLVLSKTDLCSRDDIDKALSSLKKREKQLRHILLSNVTGSGLDEINGLIRAGQTWCVLGSSGVGKSTLINRLLGREILRTGEISTSTNKGRHVTEHRELFVLENGGIIIDNPGMKELGMTDNEEGIKHTFADIIALAPGCRFPDCTHTREAGCAVLEAVEKGDIDRASYDNYLRMLKESERYTTSVSERKRKEKMFGKILKKYKKDNPKNR